VPVVELALLSVGENVVGFLQLLEALFRRLVAGVEVGVMLARELAIRRLDVAIARAAPDAQHLVVVSRLDCHKKVSGEQ
jgi:hypothetical protein